MSQSLLTKALHPQLFQTVQSLCRHSSLCRAEIKSVFISSSPHCNTRQWTSRTWPAEHRLKRARFPSRTLQGHRFTSQKSHRELLKQSSAQDELREAHDQTSGTATEETSKALGERVRERTAVLSPREDIYTIPNILTVTRLIAAPVIGYLVLHDNYVWAAGLFAYAGISDMVDGWIARRWKLQTVVGSVIDPMADKSLMAILVGCLAIKGALPLWLATLIFGRDISLAIAAIYYRYASLPAPKTFMRYWDFSLPSAEVHPTQISKWNTFLQIGLIGCTVVQPVVASSGLLSAIDVQTGLQSLQYLVAGTTLWSGASYLWTRNAVIILGEDEALKRKQGLRGRAIIGVSFAAVAALAAYFASKDAVTETDPYMTFKAGDVEPERS